MAQYKLSRDFVKVTETASVLYAMPGCSVENIDAPLMQFGE